MIHLSYRHQLLLFLLVIKFIEKPVQSQDFCNPLSFLGGGGDFELPDFGGGDDGGGDDGGGDGGGDDNGGGDNGGGEGDGGDGGGGGGVGPISEKTDTSSFQKGNDNNVFSFTPIGELIVRNQTIMDTFPAHEYGDKHNAAMKDIEADLSGNLPGDMSSYLDIVENNLKNLCYGEAMCEDGVSNYTNLALDFIVEERETFSENEGKRKLHEFIPGYDLGAEATEILDRSIETLKLGNKDRIIIALDEIHKELHGNSNLSDWEKYVVESAISVAKGSTSYWYDALIENSEGNAYRRLRRGGIKDIFDCVMGRGRVPCERRLQEEEVERQSGFNRKLRGSIPNVLNNANNVRRTIAQNTPLSYQLEGRLLGRDDDDDDFYDDDFRFDNGNRYSSPSNDIPTYGDDYVDTYDDNNYNNHNPPYYPPYNPNPPIYYNDDRDDAFNGGGNYGGGGGGYVPVTDISSSSDSESDSNDVKDDLPRWRSILRYIYFLLRADVFGLVSGIFLTRACLPAFLLTSVMFSVTYFICF